MKRDEFDLAGVEAELVATGRTIIIVNGTLHASRWASSKRKKTVTLALQCGYDALREYWLVTQQGTRRKANRRRNRGRNNRAAAILIRPLIDTVQAESGHAGRARRVREHQPPSYRVVQVDLYAALRLAAHASHYRPVTASSSAATVTALVVFAYGTTRRYMAALGISNDQL